MVVVGNYRNRAELRKKARRQFHYDARILADKDTPAIACSIADNSESGARLSLEYAGELPETFMLLLTPKGEARRHCRVIWRDGLTVGVAFPEASRCHSRSWAAGIERAFAIFAAQQAVNGVREIRAT
jgi:hypothetical protein